VVVVDSVVGLIQWWLIRWYRFLPISLLLSSGVVVVNGVRYIICIRVDFVLILWLFVYWG
jgi:hypothetical protein